MTTLLVFPMELYVLSRFAEVSRHYGGDLWMYLSPKPPTGSVLVKFQGEAFQETVSLSAGENGINELMEHANNRIKSVVACGEFSVGLADEIAKRLGLDGHTYFDCSIFRDKAKMRNAFAAANIPQPTILATLGSVEDFDDFDWDSVTFPVVVKPIDLSASLYVRICDDSAMVRQMFRRILMHRSSAAGTEFQARAIIETVVSGIEYSLECVVSRGTLLASFLTRKFLSPLPSRYEVGHMSGEVLEPQVRDNLDSIAKKVIAAGAMKDGIAHIEFKIDGDKINVIEAACRIGGDMISEITELRHGVSLEEALFVIRAGTQIDSKWISHRINDSNEWFYGIKYIYHCDKHIEAPQDIDVLRQSYTLPLEAKGDIDFNVSNRIGHILLRSKSSQEICNFISRGEFL